VGSRDVDEAVASLAARFALSDDAARAVRALLHPGDEVTRSGGETLWPDDGRAAPAPTPDGYEDLGPIGVGGMGEVRRVRDRALDRVVAMKVIRRELAGHASAVARFVEEAQVSARLQHPGLVPVHGLARLPDGRPCFTMDEIHGRPLGDVIAAVHDASTTDWRPAIGSDWTLRRLLDAFVGVCEAVGYAHGLGVVHRDLKPANVMVGAHGEVLVIDWGLAVTLGRQGVAAGAVGTRGYMAPEQRDRVAVDARADVYALGVTLVELLTGVAPALDGAVAPTGGTRSKHGLPIPGELLAIAAAAMAPEPARRPPEGSALAAQVRGWLDGSRQRERALALVAEAAAEGPKADEKLARAAELRAIAAERLAAIPAWESEAVKRPAWTLEDEAAALERDAALASVRAESLYEAALTHSPGLVEAHAELVARAQAEHAAAEAAHDADRTARAELRLLAHAEALPDGHPARQRAEAWLRGDGWLTVTTDPAGASVELHRMVLRDRRMVSEPDRELGATPVRAAVPHGSLTCRLRAPGCADVEYPVFVGRGAHADGVRPGGVGSWPIALPRTDELGPDDVYVPAGWSWSGDPMLSEGLPLRQLWCDGLVFRRFPVTNREYLAFLDDLVATGREADALRWAPRERSARPGEDGALLYGREADGRFALVPDGDGDLWHADWPVMQVAWAGAASYARWLAARTGLPWRLPSELEREKAARGVDGRPYPWGPTTDPSWCCMRDSHRGHPTPSVVDAYPVDASVYGVRGVGGNVMEWCADVARREGPPCDGAIVVPPPAATDADLASSERRVARGGSWSGIARLAACAHRVTPEPTYRHANLGFRVARSWPSPRP
jgi:formylglycine-generating enzyme required for sulfatase activity/tRNA A-37 threonylcarbamoyl transferase component Bud32